MQVLLESDLVRFWVHIHQDARQQVQSINAPDRPVMGCSRAHRFLGGEVMVDEQDGTRRDVQGQTVCKNIMGRGERNEMHQTVP